MTSSKGAPPSRRPGPANPLPVVGATILVVGADPAPRSDAAAILQRAGFVVVEAGGLEAAHEIWEVHHPEVAVVDLDRPGHPGSLPLSHLWVPQLDTAVIVTTRSDDLKLADDAFAQGAYGYVGKPHTPNELVIQVKSALRRRQLEHTVADQVKALQRKVLQGATGITRLRSQLAANGSDVADEEVVRHLCSVIRLHDADAGLHIERVSLTAAALGEWCGFKSDPAPAIRLAAAMHDVGTIGLPDWVLLKPGRLSADETAIVQRHCELGHALLSGSDSVILNLAASVALSHHERWDGTGYPKRCRGRDVPLEARITAVADVFDTLTSRRVYRAALPLETAVETMLRERGGLFEPELLDLFLERLDDVLAISITLPDPPAARITRILIVDHERVFVDGLLQIIHRHEELRVIGTASTEAEAIQALDELRPDVILSDFRLADGDGARLSEFVLAHRPETKIIILAGVLTPEVALRCISAGCSGLIPKTASGDEVTTAIRRVHDGEVVIPPALLPKVVSGLRRAAPAIGDDIAPREREVLGHLARGLSLPDIAATMSISINTARNHTQKVIEKLGAHSKLEAVLIAAREKLIDVG